MNASRLAVIGGGISGLMAAYRLRTLLGPAVEIEIFEATDRLGGTLKGVELAGRRLDVGAEAFLVRRPEVPALLDELGIAARMVHPGTLGPRILARSALEPMARPTLMGIPAEPAVVAHLAEPADLALMTDEPTRPFRWTSGQDVSIGGLVAERFGRSVVDRSVDPMLSGVYSARADDLGLRAVLPALAAKFDAGAPSLTAAVTELLGATPGQGPIFGALTDGYSELLDVLIERSAVTVRTHAVDDVRRGEDGWLVDGLAYDGVVCALAAPAAARVLDAEPALATPLSRIDVSGSAVVALALGPEVILPELSGVLVASDETVVRAKAFTFSSQKWPHLAGDGALVRASYGRFGAPVDNIDDEQLIDWATGDLSTVINISGGRGEPLRPVDAVVQRWPSGLPRYGTGHAELVAELDERRPRGLVLAGAAYNGVGVPACIGRAERAARQLVADLTG